MEQNCHAVFTPMELALSTGGVWLNRTPDESLRLTAVTDSRTANSGTIFVPLKGERFDGHDFLTTAAANGATAVMVSAATRRLKSITLDIPMLEVPDCLFAYQALGRFHRQKMSQLRVCAVTGSVGKTSVKEMLRAIFSAACPDNDAVLYTQGNTNNQIGVVQNLLRLTPAHRFAVIEMGTNHPGEIAPLSRIAVPDCAIVNSIAPCHLEYLGDLNGVAREKSTIFQYLKTHGAAVYPAQCAGHEILAHQARRCAEYQLQFGNFDDAEAVVRVGNYHGDWNGSSFTLSFASTGKSYEIQWALSGEHQAYNAAAAATAAEQMGIAQEIIAAGLRNTTLPGMRMQRTTINGIHFINDAYNANPASLKAGLATFEAWNGAPEQLMLIVGDMLELGSEENTAHREILELLDRNFASRGISCIAVGSRFLCAGESAKLSNAAHFQFYSDSIAAGAALQTQYRQGMTVFLKASRGTALEKVVGS